MNKLLHKLDSIDAEYDQPIQKIHPEQDTSITKHIDSPETVAELEEQIDKMQLAKEKILDYTLELLDTPLAPKDLKDLVSIINSLEGKQENKNQVNVVIQNIMNKFVDDV